MEASNYIAHYGMIIILVLFVAKALYNITKTDSQGVRVWNITALLIIGGPLFYFISAGNMSEADRLAEEHANEREFFCPKYFANPPNWRGLEWCEEYRPTMSQIIVKSTKPTTASW